MEPISRFVIDDGTNDDVLFPRHHCRGLELEPRPPGLAYAGVADPFPNSMLVPESEYQARIEERKALKITSRALAAAAGLKPLNQQQTNYCWVNAPTYCCMMRRVRQNQPLVLLSPASVGAQITGYRNIGGWGKQAVEWMAAKGLVPQDRWPANAISTQYATSDNVRAALDYRITEWWEIEPGNMRQLYSAVLQGFDVAVGFAWWSHEVSLVDLDWVDGTVAEIIRNSWGDWGDDGYGLIQGRRQVPDDAVTPRVMVAS